MMARLLLGSPVRRWGWQALRLLPLVALLMAPGQSCPSKCHCLAQDKVVLCNSRNLTAVPGKIPLDSELLDLSRNTLRTLHQGMFTRLQALKELDLSHNFISNIEHGAFNRLQKLMVLQLKGNNLKMVPDGVFTELPSLSVLDISANQILLFLDHSFRDLANLQKLETGDNHLVFISGHAFGGLQRLRQLTLEKCNLTSIPTEALSHLHQLVELRLKVLKVSIIPNHAFRKLLHLKVLEIHRWPFLTTLEPHSLSGLNLTSLYVTRCNLRHVPYKAIRHLAHLRVLDLSYNPISVIHGRKLVELSHLREFHLAGGRLATIQTGAFQGLIYFRLLNVTGNDLQTLEKGIFHSVGNLEVLRLDRNPLVCDCRILWIFQRRRRLNFEAHQPICATNSTREEKVFHQFSDVPRGHFTCTKPKIEDKSPQRVSVSEGEQANLTCRGDGDPLPVLSWVSPQNITLDTRRKGRITVLPDGTLKIQYALPGDSGSYLCVASNFAGNDTVVAQLHVSELLFNDSFTGNSLRFLNETQGSYLLLVDVGTLVGILALGIVPFLCSVALCFIFISLWSKGRGNVKHHMVDSVPRISHGYKAFSSPHKTEAKTPR